MYDFSFDQAASSAGTYYNSVTDSYQPVPAGAKSYGNGDANTTDVGGVWASIGGAYDTTTAAVSQAATTVVSGVRSFGTSTFNNVTGAVDSFIGWTEKNLFIFLGGTILLLWALAKTGIIPQIASIIPLMA